MLHKYTTKASSFHPEYPPEWAKLKSSRSWCVENPTAGLWWEINFNEFHWIKSISFSGGSNQPIYSFKMMYSWDGFNFQDFKNSNGSVEIFNAASQQLEWDTIFSASLWYPLLTKAVRIYPLTWHYISGWCCLRIEFFTCPADCNDPLGLDGHEFPPSNIKTSGFWQSDWTPIELPLDNMALGYYMMKATAWMEIDMARERVVSGIIVQSVGVDANVMSTFSVMFCDLHCQKYFIYADNMGNTVRLFLKTNFIKIMTLNRFSLVLAMLEISYFKPICFHLPLLAVNFD